jgi:putative N6-adenine-specific DNA methylase
VFASDSDPSALARCRANAASAGVAEWIAIEAGDVLERSAPAAAGLIVANPPYGVRLESEAALAAFYPQLGDALKQRFAGWTACLFTGDLRLAKLIGLKPSRKTPLYNGNLECRLFRFDIVAGRPIRSQAPSGG